MSTEGNNQFLVNLNELVSEEEALKIAETHKLYCEVVGEEFVVEKALAIIEQLATSRYVCTLMHLVLAERFFLTGLSEDERLIFRPATEEDKEKLKEMFGKVLLFQAFDDNEEETKEDEEDS